VDLDYDNRIPDDTLRTMEEEGRKMGLPLHRIELLGQDRAVVRGFNKAVEEGNARSYLDEVDWDRLERIHEAREHARRLGESPQGVPDLPGLHPMI
jgi:hypothetical protein